MVIGENRYMGSVSFTTIYEPPHGKTNNLHRRKQRRRSASRFSFAVTANLISAFVFATRIPQIRNFKLLALFCVCAGRFVSDLFGNHIVGFPTRRLIHCFSCRAKKIKGSKKKKKKKKKQTNSPPPHLSLIFLLLPNDQTFIFFIHGS